MKATVLRKFNAHVNGQDFSCEVDDVIEADKATIGQLEAIGLVTTKPIRKGAKPRKDGSND